MSLLGGANKDMSFFGVHRILLPALGHIGLGPGLLPSFSDQNKDGSTKHGRIRSAVNSRPSAYTDGAHQYILAFCGKCPDTTAFLSHAICLAAASPYQQHLPLCWNGGVVSGGKVSHFSLSFAVADTEFKATSQRSKSVSKRNILGAQQVGWIWEVC